ncbi:MAG: FAD:protein FMN transferase [Geminicoccaceae bacterium]|nr:FAD:protein FMN transferase [Geminicoccaceae bacterium]
MALTLNGIAQGYVTDRIADLLRAGGLAHRAGRSGRIAPPASAARRALAHRPRHGRNRTPDGRCGRHLGPVRHGHGCRRQEISHIIDPRLGRPSPGNWRRVSVLHPRAAIADGLSTGFVLLDRTAIDRALEAFPPARAITTA